MMKRALVVVFVVLLGASLLLAISDRASAQSKGTAHIRFSTWHPPVSREVKTVWIPMLEELKKRSNGRITYTMYAGGALGPGPEHFDIVAKGLSDMGYFTATWKPGRWPLTDVLSLATWVDGKDVAVDIGNEMYKRILKQEFPGVKMIELNGCIQAFLWTKKPIRSIEDCKGLRVRSPGGFQTDYIKSLGAEPIFMPLGDVYLAMETGTIDGIVTCPPLVLAFKLYEVAKHGVVATFGCVSEGVIMNEKSWAGIPDDLKPLVEEVCSNPFRTTGGLNRDVYKVMMKELADKGVALYNLPANQQEKWFKGFQEVTKTWVKNLEGKGLPAKKTVMTYNEVTSKLGVSCEAFPAEWK